MSQFKAIKLLSFLKPRKWFKIPFLSVSSIEEYEELLESDKTWHGLYKIPYALPSEMFGPPSKGWETFYKHIKKKYPVQYFFREWLFSGDNPLFNAYRCYIYWPLRDFYYASNRWFNPLFPRWRKSLKKHEYTDVSDLLVKSGFALILDFYYEEALSGYVDWMAEEIHKKFFTELGQAVHWIENTRPELELKCKNAMSKASNNDYTIPYSVKYKDVIETEQIISDKETEILIWFVNNKAFFWT